jgi:uncharacterized membrane protein YphA (DoxX/SURF4 family)
VSTVGAVARAVLGTILAISAVTKLADRNWMVSAANLGVPAVVARVVPWWELALAALLIPSIATPFAAIAAGWTLIGFTVLIASELAAGRRPTCACFGARSATPIGRMVRNGALIALSVLAAIA